MRDKVISLSFIKIEGKGMYVAAEKRSKKDSL